MPDQDPAPPYGQPSPADRGAAATVEQRAYDPVSEHDEWLAEDEELPPRPRRRLLTPLPLGLLAILLIACGFIGGVLVEKGESSTSSSSPSTGSGLASRLAALRGGTSTGSASTSGGAGAFARSGAGGGFTRPTAGTVAYLAGSTLYVTNSEGNTVKVETSPGTTVTKSVSSTVRGIHPGETVTVTGSKGSNGSVSAESISVGSSGGSSLAALFGAGAGSSSPTSTTGGGGAASLFGG